MIKKIFVACDTKNSNEIKNIFRKTENKNYLVGYKIGLEFFYSKNGRAFLKKNNKKIIFLDLKLNDIPNTCAAAIESLKDLKNIKYITAHINGGFDMLLAIKNLIFLLKHNLLNSLILD